jgi:hypothetical protein
LYRLLTARCGVYIPEKKQPWFANGQNHDEHNGILYPLVEMVKKENGMKFGHDHIPEVTGFVVTEKAMRPAIDEKVSFYCHQPVGGFHMSDCVLVVRKAVITAEVSYEITVPAHWSEDTVEFHRNESSYCADNALGEIEALRKEGHCLCGILTFKCNHIKNEMFLQER